MDDEQETYTRPSGPLTWQAVSAVALAGISGALEEVASLFEGMSTLLVGAHNHEIERRAFHEQAAREIETLTGGDFGDGD